MIVTSHDSQRSPSHCHGVDNNSEDSCLEVVQSDITRPKVVISHSQNDSTDLFVCNKDMGLMEVASVNPLEHSLVTGLECHSLYSVSPSEGFDNETLPVASVIGSQHVQIQCHLDSEVDILESNCNIDLCSCHSKLDVSQLADELNVRCCDVVPDSNYWNRVSTDYVTDPNLTYCNVNTIPMCSDKMRTRVHCVGGLPSQMNLSTWEYYLSFEMDLVMREYLHKGILHGFPIVDAEADIVPYRCSNYSSVLSGDAFIFVNDLIFKEISEGKYVRATSPPIVFILWGRCLRQMDPSGLSLIVRGRWVAQSTIIWKRPFNLLPTVV